MRQRNIKTASLVTVTVIWIFPYNLHGCVTSKLKCYLVDSYVMGTIDFKIIGVDYFYSAD